MISVAILRKSQLRLGVQLRFFVVVFMVPSFCVACVGDGRASNGRWDDCTPLTDNAYSEIVDCCGDSLDNCPGLDGWLSDMEALCRALN